MPMISLINPNQRVVDFSIDGVTITIDGLSVDCAAYQQDEPVTIEVRRGPSGPMVGGDGAYIAIIRIPAKQYIDQMDGVRVQQPLDPDTITIILWPAI